MNFLFAWRYFKAKKSTNAINIIAWVSVIAIMLITAAFIVLLSVFNGFEGLVRSLYSSFYPELRIGPNSGKSITLSASQLDALRSIKGIKSMSLVVEDKALLQNADMQTIVFLKGVDQQYGNVTEVPKRIIRGKFDLGTADRPSIVLGGGIENALAVDVERSIYNMTVYLFRRDVNISVIDPYQSFSSENIAPAGTFFIQQDIDSKYALTNIDFMKAMLGYANDEYGAVEISLLDPGQLEKIKEEVQKVLPGNYSVETRYEQNKSLYAVMNLEKWAIYGIVCLMLIVAAFTLIGALTMLVMEKQKDIQVLKAMGATGHLIKKIFLSEGLLLGSFGVFSGMLLGAFICWAQITFHLVPIQGGTFLISYYPVAMVWTDFLLIGLTVVLVVLMASWFPSRKAAREPIELKS